MAGNIWDWSRTAANNATADASINWAEGQQAFTVNDSSRQMMARQAEFLADLGCTVTSGGSADAQTLTARSSFTALATGIIVGFKAGFSNTGAATLNVNSIGAKAIRKVTSAEVALGANDIITNGLYVVMYDAAANAAAGAWILQNPALGNVLLTSNNLSELTASAGTARSNIGLGTIATQNANNVTISGGVITGITDLAVADGGTGASTQGGAQTNLGLGSMSTQAAGSVTISGGSITGITDITVADGGTGASTAAVARTNLGLTYYTTISRFIHNASFDTWQAGTSFTGTIYGPDLWKQVATAGRTFSRQVGFSGGQYCYRAQRDNGNAAVNGVSIGHVLSTELSTQLAGKQVILSADMRIGANFSGTTVGVIISTGTGSEETYTLSSATFPSGSASSGTLSPSATLTTTAQRVSWGPTTLAAGIAEVGIRFNYAPTGVAGAADYFELTNIQLEIGDTASQFNPEPLAEGLFFALRRYRKSFVDSTTPAQNVGTATGEFRAPATVAGANTNRLGSISFGQVPMLSTPSITLYNPAAANGEVRDITAPGDCSASTVFNITDKGFEITCTANASTAVGNRLGVHFVADSRAF